MLVECAECGVEAFCVFFGDVGHEDPAVGGSWVGAADDGEEVGGEGVEAEGFDGEDGPGLVEVIAAPLGHLSDLGGLEAIGGGVWGVVFGVLTGAFCGEGIAGCAFEGLDVTDDGGELFGGDGAGPEDGRGGAGEVEDGGFDADVAGSAVEDEVDGVAEFIVDMSSGGGADAGGAVGAGSGDGSIEESEEFEGEGVVGASEADGVKSGGGLVDDGGLFFDDEGKGSGPELFGEGFGGWRPMGGVSASDGFVGDVDDEGVGGGAAFDGVDFFDGVGVGGIGAEAIDGFGGEGDEAAVA